MDRKILYKLFRIESLETTKWKIKTITKKNNDSASKEDLSPKKNGNGSDSDSDDCNAEDSEREENDGNNQYN